MREDMTFREFLGIVCARWRMLLICAALFAILLGGYRTYSVMQGLADTAAAEQARDRLEWQQYEIKNKLLFADIQQLELKLNQATRYNENSLLMRIDPYNKQVAVLTFAVNTDAAALAQELTESLQPSTSIDWKADREDRIADRYLALANGISLCELMEGTAYAQVEDSYLRELVSANKSARGMLTIEAYTTEYGSGMALAEKIYSYCLNKQEAIAAAAGAHTIELVNTATLTRVDLPLMNAQLLSQNQPANISLQLTERINELENLQEPADLILTTPDAAIKSGIKYAVLGLAVGLFIGAAIAFLRETMGTHFRSGTALSKSLSSRYLGNLAVYKQKKGLDAWTNRLLDEDVFNMVAAEDRLPLLAANIREAAKDKRKLLITGMRPQSELETLARELQQRLGGDYQLSAAANLLVNAQAIQQLRDVEGVVMVEGAKTANMERVIQAKQYLDGVEGTLIGVVWA